MNKTTSRKKTKAKSKGRIRSNVRTIAIVTILIAIFSGISFYLGMALPKTYIAPIDLSGFTISLQSQEQVLYGPAHTGAKVTFQVTATSDSWTVTIFDINGFPVGGLSSSDTGTFSTPWIYAPGGCIINIQSDAFFPTSMDLEGFLIVTSSRFPFIY